MNHDELLEAIGPALRVVIVGGPGTGKTTLADRIAARYLERPWTERDALPLTRYRTDDLIGQLEWSEVSAQCAEWISRPGGFVIEGVATARSLRKWLAANPDTALDVVVVLTGQPFVELTKGQAAMNKAVSTVWNQVALEVLKRGARVINAASPAPEATSAQAAQ